MTLHRYLSPTPPPSSLAWLVCVGLLLASTWLAQDALRISEELQSDVARVERLQQRAKPKLVLKPTRADVEKQAQWSRLRAERAFQWYPIFAGLEHASEADVELLAFDPDKTGGQITLQGEGRNVEAVIEYMERLGSAPVFEQVYLAHEKIKAKGQIQTVVFEIKARLRMN